MTTTERRWSRDPAAVAVRRAFGRYGLAVGAGLAAVLVGRDGRPSASDAAMVLGVAGGMVLGAAAALQRLRGWLFFVVGHLLFVAASLAPGGLDLSTTDTRLLGIAGSGACLGGVSSFLLLAPRADLLALWLPLGLHVAAAVDRLNDRGAVAAWQRDRLALWDGPAAALLTVGVLSFVVTLAARQEVTRARWLQRPVHVDGGEGATAHRGRAALLVVVLALSALLVTPFVLRTHPTPATPDPAAPTTATTEPSSPSWQAPDATALERALRRVVAAVVDVARAAAVVGGGGAIVAVALLPLARRRRLAALGAPDPTLPPTERVRRRFVRALVALRESGVVVDGALQAPRGLVHAMADVADVTDLTDVDARGAVPGLLDAVAVWEQVRFGGRGLPEDAEERMTWAMNDVVAWAEARRTPWQACVAGFTWPRPA